jgi:nicotinamidase/pyrazinamidase
MKVLFWCVDTQKDFMDEDGLLAVPNAKVIRNHLEHLTNLARSKNFRIVNTSDWHNEDSEELSDTPNFMTTFPTHCIRGTNGAELIDETKSPFAFIVDWDVPEFSIEDMQSIEDADEITILKDRFDAWEGNPHTQAALNAINIDEMDAIFVYGVAANVCVDAAVKGLANQHKNIYVVVDAIKELPGLPLEPLIKEWAYLGVNFTTVETDERDEFSEIISIVLKVLKERKETRDCDTDDEMFYNLDVILEGIK